nr:MAG TPA: hypothetical protein [Bacteriophage sp.]
MSSEILMTKICRNSLKLVPLELIWIMLEKNLTK